MRINASQIIVILLVVLQIIRQYKDNTTQNVSWTFLTNLTIVLC